jgi:phosphoribosyl-AMP cyclohydrolase
LSWQDDIAWDEHGLVPAIAQDAASGRVLTLAWMNQKALEASIQEARAIYWSRSRGKLWRKGEESGHVQLIREVRIDCDADAILLLVEQVGGIACHTGRERCFFRKFEDGRWKETDPVLRDPVDIYGGGGAK